MKHQSLASSAHQQLLNRSGIHYNRKTGLQRIIIFCFVILYDFPFLLCVFQSTCFLYTILNLHIKSLSGNVGDLKEILQKSFCIWLSWKSWCDYKKHILQIAIDINLVNKSYQARDFQCHSSFCSSEEMKNGSTGHQICLDQSYCTSTSLNLIHKT